MGHGESAQPKSRQRSTPLVRTTYEDEDGLKWIVLVPQGKEDEAALGIVLGPPDVRALPLPEAVQRRLHEQLFNRGLITRRDLAGRATEVEAALRAANRVDVVAVMNLYKEAASGK